MPKNQLKPFEVRRNTAERQLSQFTKFVEEVEVDDIKLCELKSRLEQIKLVYNNFDEAQTEIEMLDDSEEQLTHRDSFDDEYFNATAKAKQLLPPTNSSITTNPFQQMPINLPKINLPTFSGDYNDFTQFFDLFKSLIHNNPVLNNTQKFHYLTTSLKGEAAKIIESLEICDQNYDDALKLIVERFENKKILIQNHIKELTELPTISKENYQDIRNFLDNFLKHTRALKNIGQPIEHWNSLLIYLMLNKLDYNTKKEWEILTKNVDEPTLMQFTDLLKDRCKVLENLNLKSTPKSVNFKQRSLSHVTTQSQSCVMCKGQHQIFNCKKFLELSAQARLTEARKLNICINCLRSGHSKFNCNSSGCKTCNKKHNSLLHFKFNNSRSRDSEASSEGHESEPIIVTNSTICHYNNKRQTVLLSTAILYIYDKNNTPIKCKALLDSGSMSNFMTQSLFEKLNLNSKRIDIPVAGVNNHLTHIKRQTNTAIKSLFNNFKKELYFLVIDRLTDNIPQFSFDKTALNIPHNIKLSDTNFNVSSPIDILLGAGIFFDLLNSHQIKLGRDMPTLQDTKLGWILSGYFSNMSSAKESCFLSTHLDIQSQLEKFWAIEDVPANNHLSTEEVECEQHFQKTYERDHSGRFNVELPLKETHTRLGESQTTALKRFLTLERKLVNNPALYQQYRQFMHEYGTLGHMSEITESTKKGDSPSHLIYYLPHHAVLKDSSLTTRCRVVFDASSKTTSGFSLNDILKLGPNIQDDLFNIVIRARQHKILILADITKMYRQINIRHSHRSLQRILWRNSVDENIKHFELNTVTYGTKPSSFLATRCLKQVAIDNALEYPLESKIILNDFYVDNLMTGSNNVNDAMKMITNIQYILGTAGFELRQWMSNSTNILKQLDKISNIDQFVISDLREGNALGITWDPKNDSFLYTLHSIQNIEVITKRNILSFISKIFDPLGLVGPIIIRAKIILQQLWILKLEWDDEVPMDLKQHFLNYTTDLFNLNKIQISRNILISNYIKVELHGFCDASMTAYGACIYLKSTDKNGISACHLVCAKSRVAPLKTITIPRLELCSALLLSKLMKQTINALNLTLDRTCYWSDSTIVISWIKTEPAKLKTFVANRISKIQQLTEGDWYHIQSENNPADLISRGASYIDLQRSNLWWNGPETLEDIQSYSFDTIHSYLPELPELKHSAPQCNVVTNSDMSIFTRYSNYTKLTKTTALIFRFKHNCLNKNSKIITDLQNVELDEAIDRLVLLVQGECFSREIHDLKINNHVHRRSKLASLSPFLDSKGLIRVGGRLQKSDLNYNEKHQLLLPSNHPFTIMLIRHEHHRNLHAGIQTVLSNVRQHFWIVNGRNTIRSVLRKCITCFKINPSTLSQQMGQLPDFRVKQSKVFSIVGIDYAGPFDLKDGKTRNRKLIKSYICVFVCLSTKAMHIEVVTDLTSDTFLNALKRFVARRGVCTLILSDNAKTFVGANNKLNETLINSNFKTYCSNNKIEWKFIPARSPHFGGIWESAVKSIKYHLKRVSMSSHMTYEEFNTLVIQIEAILNSRPLTPMSADPNDLEPLTPAHFLIGCRLDHITQHDVQEINTNRLVRYHVLQKMIQQFWKRWSKEYLNNMQQRTKWKFQKYNDIHVGSLVILKEDNLPPCQWLMARITALHPGPDNIVRAVSVKSGNLETKRAITKICLLPID